MKCCETCKWGIVIGERQVYCEPPGYLPDFIVGMLLGCRGHLWEADNG